MKQYILVLFLLVGSWAQSQVAYLYTDQDSVLVGEPFDVKLEFSGLAAVDIESIQWDTLDKLQFIDYTDTTFYDVDFEITMGKFSGDNYIYDKGEITWDKNETATPPTIYNTFTMTVWEMCVLGIPGPTVRLTNGQEFTVNPRYLLVKDPMLATTQDFAPSKQILKEKVTFFDKLKGYLWLIILLAAMLAAYLYSRYLLKKKKNEPIVIEEEIPEPEPIIPAHTIALEKLGALKSKRTWETGEDKQYVSELTEIIREYIENRFGVLALEMTSTEITEALKSDILNQEQLSQLSNTLNVSDMIKFAKAKADSNLYEQFVDDAIDLVQDTKKADIVEPNTDSE